MRISIHTFGTRGDFQPYLALALGLRARGHDVQLAAPRQFADTAEEHRVCFAPLPGELLDLIGTPEGKAALTRSKGFGAGLGLLKHARPLMRDLLDADWKAVRAFAPDLLIYHPKSLAVPHISERIGAPCMLASPLPGFTPTSAFPTPILPFSNLGPLNKVSHELAAKSASVLFSGLLREFRASLDLPPARRQRSPAATLYAYSPRVVPRPADWGSDILVSGYWFLDAPSWAPDPDLAAFLTAGEPPIYIGFGSMPGRDPQQLTQLCVEALARCGKRGVLATGGGALAHTASTPLVRAIAEAPHHQLFSYVGATIHHGGAGTTGAALRAGKPTTACPFFGDQPFWARRIAQLGVGPPALDRKHLTPDRLGSAIMAMDDPDMKARASSLGAAIRTEDGIASAVNFIEMMMATPRAAARP